MLNTKFLMQIPKANQLTHKVPDAQSGPIWRHYILQPTLAPLVHKQRRWLCVCRLDPGREETPLVSFIPQVLIQVSICNLLKWFNIIDRDQVTIKVHELNPHLK